MNYNIDEMSTELTQEMQMSALEKALPPKLRYRYYKWIKSLKNRVPQLSQQQINTVVQKAIEDMKNFKELKKHQASASFFDDGTVRLDFGPQVAEKVKKAALDWARRRGLKILEESVNKSKDAYSYSVFGKTAVSDDAVLIKFIVLNP
jgi:hypothetical protein